MLTFRLRTTYNYHGRLNYEDAERSDHGQKVKRFAFSGRFEPTTAKKKPEVMMRVWRTEKPDRRTIATSALKVSLDARVPIGPLSTENSQK